ncbi:MAG: hypothetical protein JZU62_05060 [Sulfuricurvum sp.]|uniref:hypothetical protein n=1 Tax=Sulfuricurvum sp. TaxID=2025608 RepID=UPI0025ECC523|nr:hypothetical protein [Sulfuricurvum sp.]MBV5321033.1 hypothetical protein [Sulfuricurvum sp.]
MQTERKNIIRFALDYDIEEVNTYAGYKGDLVVKIVSKDIDTIAEIQKYANTLDVLDVVVKHNPHLLIYELFCVTKDKEAYHIKKEPLGSKEHVKHDVWGNVGRED